MIASALFANGIHEFGRHKKDNSPQGIFCANGQCSQCLVIANGIPVKSCIVPVKQGMDVRSLDGLPSLLKDDDVVKLNDVAAEYWAGHFEEYSIKMYFRGSIQHLREETKYILEEITLDTFGSYQERGLGSEYHLISKKH